MTPKQDFLEIQTRTSWARSLELFASWLRPQAGGRALDIGSGPGLLARYLAQAGMAAVAVDLDFMGAARLHPSLAQADARRLPFAAATFDLVAASNLLFLLDDPTQALSEFARVLHPNGQLVLLNPSEEMSVERVRALADRRKLQGVERASLLTWAERAESRPRWDEMTLRDLLAAHGLRLIETELRLGPGLARFGRAVPAARLVREFATQVRPQDDAAAQQQAAALLAAGEVVALPTDTVYGLAARLDNPVGIAQLYEVKGRDQLKAIAVLVADPSDLSGVAGDLPPGAARLATQFWPGALTLVTSRSRNLPANLSTQPTVGVRVPDHAATRDFLRRTGPLAVTSANLSGAANSVSAAQVQAQLAGRIPLILDGGETPGGQPSTVVDCTGSLPLVLRAGPIGEAELRAVWEGGAGR